MPLTFSMLEWLTANLGTLAAGALVLALAARAVWVLRKNKKQGKSPCGCAGCTGCCGCKSSCAAPAADPAAKN